MSTFLLISNKTPYKNQASSEHRLNYLFYFCMLAKESTWTYIYKNTSVGCPCQITVIPPLSQSITFPSKVSNDKPIEQKTRASERCESPRRVLNLFAQKHNKWNILNGSVPLLEYLYILKIIYVLTSNEKKMNTRCTTTIYQEQIRIGFGFYSISPLEEKAHKFWSQISNKWIFRQIEYKVHNYNM